MRRIFRISIGIFADFQPGFRSAGFEGGGDGVGEGIDDPVVETVDPTVDADFLAAFPGVLDDGGAGDVAGLGEHVELAEPVGGGVRRERVEFLAVHAAERADAGEPVVDHAVAEVLPRRLDAAAAIVAADDDVADLEHVHGVLQHGEHVEVGLGDHVGDVPVHEDLAGRESGDLVGGHPAVRATDPEVVGTLLVGELREKLRVVRVDGGRPFAVV